MLAGVGDNVQLLAAVTAAFGRLIIGRASIRLTDLAVDLLNAGPRAFPVAGVVNFLGRWASRLSILATNLLTARLATRAPGALVTDQWRGTAPDYRIMVQVTRLDVTTAGVASSSAHWQIVPRDRQLRILRDRTRIRLTGPVATDQEVVELETRIFERLAGAIRLPQPVFPTRSLTP